MRSIQIFMAISGLALFGAAVCYFLFPHDSDAKKENSPK